MSGVLAGLLGFGEGVFDKVYNYWRDQVSDNRAERDFDYQKHLQQEIFQREDTAVQRRMADLQAAGLNPNLAAGSAASAGAVVGRSSTPVSHFGGVGNTIGTALDTASAALQLSAQRKQNQILDNQKMESSAKATLAKNQALLDNLYLVQMLGLNPKFGLSNSGNLEAQYEYDDSSFTFGHYKDTPMYKQLEWQVQNNKNAAYLLQKDADYYKADKIFEYIGAGARAAGNLTGGVGSIGTAYRNFNYRR